MPKQNLPLLFLLCLTIPANILAQESDSTDHQVEPTKESTDKWSTGEGFLNFEWSPTRSSQLRSGSSKADRPALPRPSASTPVGTNSQAFAVGVGWRFPFGLSDVVSVPWVVRKQTSIAAGDSTESTSKLSGLGDITVRGSYTGLKGPMPLYFHGGVKLPTGSTRARYSAGPGAGRLVDRKAQLGTGSTDLLVGASNYVAGQMLSINGQIPILHQKSFTPGIKVDASWSYMLDRVFFLAPQVQVLGVWEGSEAGSQADPSNSGSFQIDLVPRLNVFVGIQMWAELNWPLYYRVKGLQTVPSTQLSLGASTSI